MNPSIRAVGMRRVGVLWRCITRRARRDTTGDELPDWEISLIMMEEDERGDKLTNRRDAINSPTLFVRRQKSGFPSLSWH
jgi:hypothetical protein